MRVRLSFLITISTLAYALAGCGPLAGTTTTTTTNANVRAINGSPDAGAIDVRLNTTTGQAIAGSLAYGSVGAYNSVSSAVYSIVILPAGGSAATLTCGGASLGAGLNYTVVVAGKVTKGVGTTAGLQCQLFSEPTFSTPTGDYTLSVHHASPAAAAVGDSTISFGTYTPGTTTYGSPDGTATYSGSIVSGLVNSSYYSYVATGVTTAPGVGFWIAPQTSTTPATVLTTILPSAGQTGASGANGTSDTGNLLPSGSLINFSIYLIDGQGANLTKVVGAFD